MARPRSRRRFLGATGVIIVLLGTLGVIVVTQINDFVCSDTEREAMAEFPLYGGVTPDWESNAKTTGGCKTTYIVDAHPDEAIAYYREWLAAHNWTVTDTPVSSELFSLTASRGDLRYSLMFEGAGQDFHIFTTKHPPPTPSLGQTRVWILGGHRD